MSLTFLVPYFYQFYDKYELPKNYLSLVDQWNMLHYLGNSREHYVVILLYCYLVIGYETSKQWGNKRNERFQMN